MDHFDFIIVCRVGFTLLLVCSIIAFFVIIMDRKA